MPAGYFQFGYFNLSLVQNANGTTLLVALRNYLKSLDALNPITEVYLRRTADDPAFPFMVISPINESHVLNTGPDYEEDKDLQFSVVANDDLQAETLGKAAFDHLMPKASNPLLVWDDGNETVRYPLFSGRLAPERGQGADNLSVWSYTFGFRWSYARART